MRSRMRDQKGITVVALVITVAVLIILTTTMVIGISSRYESQRLDKLSSDLKLLKDKVLIYYSENGNYPIVEGTLQEESKYEIDLSKLDGLTLNYGNKVGGDDDVYLIDIAKGEISYEKGIEYKGQRYYKILDEQIDSVNANNVLKITSQQVTIKDGSGNVTDIDTITDKSYFISLWNGHTVSVTVNTSLTGVTYEWYRNDQIINEATTQTYEISEPENNDTYYCKVIHNGISKNSSKIIINTANLTANLIGYQELDYIESTGTQYIDTGVTLKQSIRFSITFKTNIESRQNKTTQTNATLIGAGDNTSNIIKSFNYGSNIGQKEIFLWSGIFYEKGNVIANTSSTPFLNKSTIELKSDGYWYINGTKNNTLQKSSTGVSDFTLLIFGYNSTGTKKPFNYGNMTLYGTKIYDGDTLIRDFVPCYRKSDGEIGLYDIVYDVFYTNAGTGTFVIGNAVN